MASRKRGHVSLTEKLASALIMHPSIPQEVRDELRRLKVPAKQIVSAFDFDHNILHAFDGPDEWWNLTPMLRSEHRQKSRGDTSIAAKVKRISRATEAHQERMRRKLLAPPEATLQKEKPKAKIQSRGFPKKGKNDSPNKNSRIRPMAGR